MTTGLLIWVLVWTIIAFALMGIDKWKAVGGSRRIPEKTLLLFSLFGGGMGGGIGMRRQHHKTKKHRFRILVPLLAGIQGTIFIFLMV